MAFADIHNLAINAGFQGQCYVAAWMVANDILADSNAAPARKDWARRAIADKLSITPKQLAFQVLRNAVVQTAGVNSTDAQFTTAVQAQIATLVAIG